MAAEERTVKSPEGAAVWAVAAGTAEAEAVVGLVKEVVETATVAGEEAVRGRATVEAEMAAVAAQGAILEEAMGLEGGRCRLHCMDKGSKSRLLCCLGLDSTCRACTEDSA